MSNDDPGNLLYAGFNQNDSLFVLGTENGYVLYNTEPFREIARRRVGGVGHVAMLHRSNILGLVGGGHRPLDSNNKVIIWDDAAQQPLAELEFRTPVLSAQFRIDRLVIATQDKVFVYDFPGNPIRLLKTYDTCDNPRGLLAVCPSSSNPVVAMPGRQTGHVHVVDVGSETGRAPQMLKAHEHGLACVALSYTGRLLATASDIGTRICVFDTATKQKLHEFRRGSFAANVLCIRFNHDASLLCASSEHTIHLFSLKNPERNRPSTLGLVGEYLPSFKAGRSMFKFNTKCPSLCAFGTDRQSVVAVCSNATFHQFAFDEQGPRPDRNKFSRLLKINEWDALFRIASDDDDGDSRDKGQGSAGGDEGSAGQQQDGVGSRPAAVAQSTLAAEGSGGTGIASDDETGEAVIVSAPSLRN
eukprot:m.208967 g.208967  ORF g.208967 m.208967 type:complete len:415 (-) comp18543_c1_seq2:62-1306(-)